MSRALLTEMLVQPLGGDPLFGWCAVDPAIRPAYTTTYPEWAAVAREDGSYGMGYRTVPQRHSGQPAGLDEGGLRTSFSYRGL